MITIHVKHFNRTLINDEKLNNKITYSANNGGCGMNNCNCSPGHWLAFATHIDNNILYGTNITFENKNKMNLFIENFNNYNNNSLLSVNLSQHDINFLKENLKKDTCLV